MKRAIYFLLISISFLLDSCGVKALCLENKKEDCVCIQVYEPVCGCNNKTYSNACEAKCAGITQYTPGECGAAADKKEKS